MTTTATKTETAAPQQGPTLGDEALRRFLRDGYLTVQTSLPRDFHEDVRGRLQSTFDKEGNWGNNILARVPALQRVLDDPGVRGALSSILGPTYVAHPHRHAHLNLPGSTAQRLHKDTLDFSGDKQPPHHRPRWAIAFYYPQDVTADMGPTGIAPGTQYLLEQPDPRQYPEITARGPAGTVTIVHFDIWHRGTANVSTTNRFMVKFEFGRMDEPAPAAGGVGDGLRSDEAGADGAPHARLRSYLYEWLRGRTPAAGGAGAGEALPSLARALREGDEAARLDAAYALGLSGAPAVAALADTMRDGPDVVRRYAGYGLSTVGAAAVDALVDLARSPDESVRRAAVDALGDMGHPAAPAVDVLARSLRDESKWVRRQAAEAMGTAAVSSGPAVPALMRALGDEAPFVRFNAALALARIGRDAAEAVPALVGALGDPDRYARGWAAIALRRIGTPEATDALLDDLMTARWCPITSTESRY